MSLGAHHVDDAVALATTEQAVVDEDAGQLIADGAVHERGGDGRVDATAERADDLAVADLPTQGVDGHLDERRSAPGSGATADVDEEVAQDVATQRGVRDLGVELDAVATVRPDERRARRVERVRDRAESVGQRGDDVAVRHPDRELRR